MEDLHRGGRRSMYRASNRARTKLNREAAADGGEEKREGRDLLERSARGEEERTWRRWRPARRGGEGRGRRWGRRKSGQGMDALGCLGPVGGVAHRIRLFSALGAWVFGPHQSGSESDYCVLSRPCPFRAWWVGKRSDLGRSLCAMRAPRWADAPQKKPPNSGRWRQAVASICDCDVSHSNKQGQAGMVMFAAMQPQH